MNENLVKLAINCFSICFHFKKQKATGYGINLAKNF